MSTREVTQPQPRQEESHTHTLALPPGAKTESTVYPTDILSLLQQPQFEFNIGDTVISPDEPKRELTVGEVKYNPATGQYMLEAFDEYGNRVPVFGGGYLGLPAPRHYENILEGKDPFAWIRFKQDSPLYKIYDQKVNKKLPMVIDESYRDYIMGLFEQTALYNPIDEDYQSLALE
jgi:hypothetical protein